MKGKRVLKRQRNNDGLLGTYFASLFSVVLCVIMLFGTTFAWFHTDNTSTGNEIHSGILKVDMLHNGTSLTEQAAHQVFSSGVLWTPQNSVQEEIVEIHNTGNVVLDYKLDIVPVPNKQFSEQAAELFTVFVDGVKVGGLDQFLSDLDDKTDDFILISGQGLDPGAFRGVKVGLQMNAELAQGVMGHKVPIYLKLEAYQNLAGESG